MMLPKSLLVQSMPLTCILFVSLGAAGLEHSLQISTTSLASTNSTSLRISTSPGTTLRSTSRRADLVDSLTSGQSSTSSKSSSSSTSPVPYSSSTPSVSSSPASARHANYSARLSNLAASSPTSFSHSTTSSGVHPAKYLGGIGSAKIPTTGTFSPSDSGRTSHSNRLSIIPTCSSIVAKPIHAADASVTSSSLTFFNPDNGLAPPTHQFTDKAHSFEQEPSSSSTHPTGDQAAGASSTENRFSFLHGHNQQLPKVNGSGDNASLFDNPPPSDGHNNNNYASPTTSHPYPDYIIPSDMPIKQTRGCNAYGPICQTGSTVVGINETGTVVTKTVACSSYLSAQSQSVSADLPALSSWRAHFGRSPQCTSYAKIMKSQASSDVPSLASSCGLKATAFPTNGFLPPGVLEPFGLNDTVPCCGPCAIFVHKVDLLYFPGEDAGVECDKTVDTTKSTVTAAPDVKEVRTSLFITKGFTYTSGSIYFEIMGTASFEDACGQLGTKVVSSTLAIPTGVMSTVSFDVPIGASLPRGTRAEEMRQMVPLNTRDLACPTWGVNMPIPSDGPDGVTVGYPFYPLLVPPPQLLTIDVAWSKCVGNHWPLRFGIFDPPRALTPNSVMVGPATPYPASASPGVMTAQGIAVATPGPDTPAFPASGDESNPQMNQGLGGLGGHSSQNDSDGGSSNAGSDSPGSGSAKAENPSSGASGSQGFSSDDTFSETSGRGNVDIEGPSSGKPGSQGYDAGSPGSGSGGSSTWNDLNSVESNMLNLFSGTAFPIIPSAHAMTIGSLTYTKGPSLNYIMYPSQTLTVGGSITMSDGTIVSLPADCACAVIGSSTQQLSEVVTGIAPAFAGVVGTENGVGATSESASPGQGVQGLQETATFSAHGYLLSAVPAPTDNHFILKGSGDVIASLIPGGPALTIMGNEVVSMGKDGLLRLNGNAVATMTMPSASTKSRVLGAVIATAFNMGANGPTEGEVTAGSNETTSVSPNTSGGSTSPSAATSGIFVESGAPMGPTAFSSSGAQPAKGGAIKFRIPCWERGLIVLAGVLLLIIYTS